MSKFKDAFAPLHPILVERFEAHVVRNIKRYAENWDDLRPDRVRAVDYTWRFVRSFAVMDSNRMSARPTGEIKVDWLRKMATENTDAQIAGFAAKLESKLGDLGEFEATFSHGTNFTVRGERNGHQVVVEQRTVFKVSNQGVPFNQFPARVYVDGKFTPAARYEEAVA